MVEEWVGKVSYGGGKWWRNSWLGRRKEKAT
jgi:hypothetical protein